LREEQLNLELEACERELNILQVLQKQYYYESLEFMNEERLKTYRGTSLGIFFYWLNKFICFFWIFRIGIV